jgi:hypothetical protein
MNRTNFKGEETMKEIEAPAMVAKAETEICSAIVALAEQISPLYRQSVRLRAQVNTIGIEIGRHIIDACRSAEVEAKLAVLNSKGQKLTGGTDTRAHSWVAEQLATASGYNAEYLKQCARQYLGALTQHCVQTRQEAPQWVKGGVLKCALKTLPTLELKPPIVKQPDHPRMDELFTSSESKIPETKTATERAKQAFERVNSLLGEGDRIAWREFFNAISPCAEAHGFAIMPKGKNGGNFK